MKPEIEGIFGNILSDKVSALLENLGGIGDMIEEKFSLIQKDLQ
jgi:hypothetical protein